MRVCVACVRGGGKEKGLTWSTGKRKEEDSGGGGGQRDKESIGRRERMSFDQ